MKQVGSPVWTHHDRHHRAWYFTCSCPALNWIPQAEHGYCPECRQTVRTGILFASNKKKLTAQQYALETLKRTPTWEAIFLF